MRRMSEASGIVRPMPYKASDHLTHRITFFFGGRGVLIIVKIEFLRPITDLTDCNHSINMSNIKCGHVGN